MPQLDDTRGERTMVTILNDSSSKRVGVVNTQPFSTLLALTNGPGKAAEGKQRGLMRNWGLSFCLGICKESISQHPITAPLVERVLLDTSFTVFLRSSLKLIYFTSGPHFPFSPLSPFLHELHIFPAIINPSSVSIQERAGFRCKLSFCYIS